MIKWHLHLYSDVEEQWSDYRPCLQCNCSLSYEEWPTSNTVSYSLYQRQTTWHRFQMIKKGHLHKCWFRYRMGHFSLSVLCHSFCFDWYPPWTRTSLCPQVFRIFIRNHHPKQCRMEKLPALSARLREYPHLLLPGKRTKLLYLRRQGEPPFLVVVPHPFILPFVCIFIYFKYVVNVRNTLMSTSCLWLSTVEF